MSTYRDKARQPSVVRPEDPKPKGPPRRWAALVTISVAQLMISVDSTIVNIALPSAQSSWG